MFVDEVTVHLRAGDGGAGVVSFLKQKGRPKGKPEGGSGGAGGDVIVQADLSMASLLEYKRRPHRRAEAGTHGQGDLRAGRRGDDLVLLVPVGTVVKDESGRVLADLVEAGQQVKVLEGGRGGRGNAALMSRANVAPGFAEQGEYGQERSFVFELKLLADAALIGYPNAGKSTLISRVSAAKPKIADYPFTTLEPNLGVVAFDDREFVMADIPGLIEGAADGRGLGHQFLRHVERARALVVLLDPSDLQEASPLEQYRVLVAELESHDPDLARRPRLVAVGKADVGGAEEAAQAVRDATGEQVLVFSAITGDGLTPLVHAIADLVALAEREAPDRSGFMLHRPLPPSFDVTRVGDRWVVSGLGAERAVALDDLTNPAAADFAARRLQRLGVDDALRNAGAVPGDDVQIGDLVFEFMADSEEE